MGWGGRGGVWVGEGEVLWPTPPSHATCTIAPGVPPPAPTCLRAVHLPACHVPRVTCPTRRWPLPPGPPRWEAVRRAPAAPRAPEVPCRTRDSGREPYSSTVRTWQGAVGCMHMGGGVYRRRGSTQLEARVVEGVISVMGRTKRVCKSRSLLQTPLALCAVPRTCGTYRYADAVAVPTRACLRSAAPSPGPSPAPPHLAQRHRPARRLALCRSCSTAAADPAALILYPYFAFGPPRAKCSPTRYR